MVLVRFIMNTIRLGLRPRSWLAHQDPLSLEMTQKLVESASQPCSHPPEALVRSGSQYGSFCKCSQCGVKWRYNKSEAAWQERPSSQQLPLPQPSDSASARRPAWAVKALPIPEASSSSTTPATSTTFFGRPRSAKDHLKPKAAPKGGKTRKAQATEEEQAEDSEDYDWALLMDD